MALMYRIVDGVGTVVRPLVPRHSGLERALQRARHHLPSAPFVGSVNAILHAFGALCPDAFFVQIGSHDGHARDPLLTNIETHRWHGVMVEPVPYVFERLCSHYGDHAALQLVNVAIADHDGSQALYYLPQSDDPDLVSWYDALASFNRQVLLSHTDFIPDVAERIATMEVPCWTFDTLVERAGIGTIDVLQIDTEGYDFEVIKLVDFDQHLPSVLMYESLHLSETDSRACTDLLAERGYQLLCDGMDTIAVQPDAGDRRFQRLFHRLAHKERT
jgi:FkbM family methyltransferase